MKTRILSLLLLLNVSVMPLLAMNPIIDSSVSKLQSKLSTYAALLNYRYKCLCVKTSPEALLPIEVNTPQGDLPLEEVAKAVIMDEENFQIYPQSQDMLEPICQAFLTTYPQLKQKIVLLDQMDNIDPVKILQLTTPDITDDVKKQLDKTVDILRDQTIVKYEKVLAEEKLKLANALAKDQYQIKEGNDKLDEAYGKMMHEVEQYTDDEHSDIADENRKYNERPKKPLNGDTDNKPVIIEDGEVIYVPRNMVVQQLTFKRSFAQNVLHTFCVPFSFRSSDVPGKFYVFGSFDAGQNMVNLDPYTGLIEAGKGYFYLPDQDIEQLDFTKAKLMATTVPTVPDEKGLYGTLSKYIFLEDAYLMQSAADGTPKLVKADAEATLAPYQSYLWLGIGTEATELTIHLSDTSTAISTPDADTPQRTAPIYDLRGQRIGTPRRGEVYMQEGRKRMMRP